MNKPDICVFHSPCADGFTAAWAVWLKWPDIEFVPGAYAPGSIPDVTGKHVLIVDFSYKADVLRQMAATAASITILDHHVSAQRDLEPLLADGTIQGQFDMTRSGAMMTWNYIWPWTAPNPFSEKGEVPYIVQYVQDRDLWNWKLPNSKEVCASLNLLPLEFKAWSEAAEALEDCTGFDRYVEIGTALVKKLDSDVGSGIRATKRTMKIGGYVVPVANLPHFLASEAGNVLSRGAPFAATYFDSTDGHRSFSLRSDKDDPEAVDVSVIAGLFGGGGHKNASGFRAPPGWEGEG